MKRLLVLLGLLALPLFAAAGEFPTSTSHLGRRAVLDRLRATAKARAMRDAPRAHRTPGEIRRRREIVPATMERGKHINPVLGYDAESGTLFVFWILPRSHYNQLLFVTRDSAGNWSAPTSSALPTTTAKTFALP